MDVTRQRLENVAGEYLRGAGHALFAVGRVAAPASKTADPLSRLGRLGRRLASTVVKASI